MLPFTARQVDLADRLQSILGYPLDGLASSRALRPLHISGPLLNQVHLILTHRLSSLRTTYVLPRQAFPLVQTAL